MVRLRCELTWLSACRLKYPNIGGQFALLGWLIGVWNCESYNLPVSLLCCPSANNLLKKCCLVFLSFLPRLLGCFLLLDALYWLQVSPMGKVEGLFSVATGIIDNILQCVYRPNWLPFSQELTLWSPETLSGQASCLLLSRWLMCIDDCMHDLHFCFGMLLHLFSWSYICLNCRRADI
jgi:hypothetical protein